jgi:hypothetical protein
MNSEGSGFYVMIHFTCRTLQKQMDLRSLHMFLFENPSSKQK